jgi:hypothetical protein
MANRPIEHWVRLRNSGDGDGAIEVPSISSGVDTGYGYARFAVGPNGEPRLLVPAGPGGQKLGNLSAGKLAVQLSRYTLNGRATLFLDVMCLEQPLDAVFAEIADEILHRISSGVAPGKSVETTISDFRELLQDSDRRTVEESKVIGLLGELVVLEMLCRTSPAAIEAWTGPFDQRHDFRRRGQAIEVKTSSRADATSVVISSIEQLTEPANGVLTLAHVRMERAMGGSLTVAKLVQKIVSLGVGREDIQRRLSSISCDSPDSDAWNNVEFSLEGISAYRVREGFPRINSSAFEGGKLPAGITAISYTVDLSAAKEFLLDEYGLNAALQGIAL